MTVSLGEIRQALARVVHDRCGVQAYAYARPQIVTPCVVPLDISAVPVDMGGSDDVTVTLAVMVAATEESGIARLDELVDGECSVPAAIDADPTLGLDGVAVQWTEWGGTELTTWAGVEVWVTKVQLMVLRS